MAWTAPMTAVANTAFTAAQFNTYLRDNLLETAPAKATVEGRIFVSTGVNAIAERVPSHDFVTTVESTSSTTFTDLATGGPSVTVVTGTRALVMIGGELNRTTASDTASVRMSFAVSGASTEAATDAKGLSVRGVWTSTSQWVSASKVWLQTGLTPGTNTFTTKYRVSSGTGQYDSRYIAVIPF